MRRKFANLHRKKIPTRDLHMATDVHRAKRFLYKMTERAYMDVDDDSRGGKFFPTKEWNETPNNSLNLQDSELLLPTDDEHENCIENEANSMERRENASSIYEPENSAPAAND